MSAASQEKIAQMERNHKKAMEEMNEKLVTLQVAHDNVMQIQQQNANENEKLKSEFANAQNVAAEERRELMKKHVDETEEMMKNLEAIQQHSRELEEEYGKLQKDMRLSRDMIHIKKQEEIDEIQRKMRQKALESDVKMKKARNLI